jgi:type III secretion system chaperone SycN
MTNLESVLAEFGRSIGISGLAFNENQAVHLKLERDGHLYFEHAPEAKVVTVALARTIQAPKAELWQEALALCHREQRHPIPVNAGLAPGERLAFFVRFGDEEISLPGVESAIQLLTRLHQRVTPLAGH